MSGRTSIVSATPCVMSRTDVGCQRCTSTPLFARADGGSVVSPKRALVNPGRIVLQPTQHITHYTYEPPVDPTLCASARAKSHRPTLPRTPAPSRKRSHRHQHAQEKPRKAMRPRGYRGLSPSSALAFAFGFCGTSNKAGCLSYAHAPSRRRFALPTSSGFYSQGSPPPR